MQKRGTSAVGQPVDDALVELLELRRACTQLSSDIMRTACFTCTDVRARLAPDALGGRVGGPQLGVIVLEGAQLAQQRVELGVADARVVEDVVPVVVRVDLAYQLGVTLGGLHEGRGLSRARASSAYPGPAARRLPRAPIPAAGRPNRERQ